MTIDIWNACHGGKNITGIHETAWRMTELLEKTSTRKLVDSIEEQKILDQIIEESIPAIHPLLSRPFKTPPLKYGSRFGKKTEASLWYGSLNPETAMTEKAYYQLAFINASAGDFGTITSPIYLFSVELKIKRGIRLNEEPFVQYTHKISSPVTYEDSQSLGRRMRENHIDGFSFVSARDAKNGINIGLFNTNAFVKRQPDTASQQTWQCNTSKNSVEFIRIGLNDHSLSFLIQSFMIDGNLPFPAV